jgi:oxygen-dependent protoporphyrinogen oxidase
VREFDESLAQTLETIAYASWVTVNLAFQRTDIAHPLSGFGFVVPAIERLPISGCTFSHVKFPGRAPEGTVLLRVFMRDEEHADVRQSDGEYAQTAIRTLQPLVGICGDPLVTAVHRSPRALPQYRVGHLARITAIQQRLTHYPGLVVAGNAYQGHGVTNCIGSAEQAAHALCEHVAHQTSLLHA